MVASNEVRLFGMWASPACREEARKAFYMEGEEKENSIENLQVQLKALDEQLEGKKFFYGDHIGYTDLAVGWMAFWLGVAEEVAGFKANHEAKFPHFARWIKDFLQEPVIKENLPTHEKTVDFFRAFRQLGGCGKMNQK
ncbi:glutathione transferase GST 23-like protein [Carex littledalei]|uniref:Glutathione transferase GST 23-like protein n=1 Tax=Carex littledalei TaxID=544730 RepID=A0A833QQF6_9POAL|nr:glutathione transferase GST 23-like protein [Carex littledalei]